MSDLGRLGITPGERRSLSIQKVASVADLVLRLPRWHVHRDRIVPLAEAKDGRRDFFLVRIEKVGAFARGRLHVIRLALTDLTGRAQAFWFNRPWMLSALKPGRALLIRDAAERGRAGVRFSGQTGTVEAVSDAEAARLERGDVLTFYRSTPTIPQARARELAAKAVAVGLDQVPDPLPEDVRARRALPVLRDALRDAHTPPTWAAWEASRRRLAYEQLFLLHVALGVQRRTLAAIRKARRYVIDGKALAAFTAGLPFALTGAQTRAVGEVLGDLARPAPMNRLLQGDVGSGKTAVAAAAVAAAADSGFQSAVLAPTEILAEQHFHTFRRLLAPANVRVGLVTGGQRKATRKQVQAGLEGGYFDLVVGTHALLETDVQIPRLGLAVMDERHRFGVNQRAVLEKKADHPDMLMMTATPLPRAMVLTRYGDTSLSLIDEPPPGRGIIRTTWAAGAAQRADAFKFTMERLRAGERAFAVFPLVEESERLELKDATREHERLTKLFAEFRVGLIHGRMSGEEKSAVMKAFGAGEIQLLVATSVIEVGIDVPAATVMLIEHADRFGLAQLHQLRGRIGRGKGDAWCFLVTAPHVTSEARERLTAMVRTTNGFELAEADLRLRGPGELFGVRQHGLAGDEVEELYLDPAIMEPAREDAEAVVAADPDLESGDGTRIQRALHDRLDGAWGLARAS